MTKIGRCPRRPGLSLDGSGVWSKRRLRSYSRRLIGQSGAPPQAAFLPPDFFLAAAFLAGFLAAAFLAVFFAVFLGLASFPSPASAALPAFLAGVRFFLAMLCCSSSMKSTTLVAAWSCT